MKSCKRQASRSRAAGCKAGNRSFNAGARSSARIAALPDEPRRKKTALSGHTRTGFTPVGIGIGRSVKTTAIDVAKSARRPDVDTNVGRTIDNLVSRRAIPPVGSPDRLATARKDGKKGSHTANEGKRDDRSSPILHGASNLADHTAVC